MAAKKKVGVEKLTKRRQGRNGCQHWARKEEVPTKAEVERAADMSQGRKVAKKEVVERVIIIKRSKKLYQHKRRYIGLPTSAEVEKVTGKRRIRQGCQHEAR